MTADRRAALAELTRLGEELAAGVAHPDGDPCPACGRTMVLRHGAFFCWPCHDGWAGPPACPIPVVLKGCPDADWYLEPDELNF